MEGGGIGEIVDYFDFVLRIDWVWEGKGREKVESGRLRKGVI